MSAYEALVFDLGKVVFDLSFDRVFQFWAHASGSSYADIKRRFQFDAVFDAFEKDEITPAAFRREISKRLGLALADQVFDRGWCELYLDAYPGVEELLSDLKQRYQLVALTNTNRIHASVWKRKYAPVLRHFQKVFSSHELKERKPNASAFELVLGYLRVRPEQVVFLDDNADNINGAKQLGMATILVTSYAQMTTELRAVGLLK